MNNIIRSTTRPFVIALLTVLVAACANTQSGTTATADATESPAYLTEKASPVSARWFLGPQPSASDLVSLKQAGVAKVINFRTEQEMSGLEFDEENQLRQLGIDYVQIPLQRGQYTPGHLELVRQALAVPEQTVLLHCGSGWRASELMVAYLIEHEGWEISEALEHAIGWWPLSLENTLGRKFRLVEAD